MNNKKKLEITALLACVLFPLNITAAFTLPTQANAAFAECSPHQVVAKKGEVLYAECGDTVIAEDGSEVTAKVEAESLRDVRGHAERQRLRNAADRDRFRT